jgi:hypothetical protein
MILGLEHALMKGMKTYLFILLVSLLLTPAAQAGKILIFKDTVENVGRRTEVFAERAPVLKIEGKAKVMYQTEGLSKHKQYDIIRDNIREARDDLDKGRKIELVDAVLPNGENIRISLVPVLEPQQKDLLTGEVIERFADIFVDINAGGRAKAEMDAIKKDLKERGMQVLPAKFDGIRVKMLHENSTYGDVSRNFNRVSDSIADVLSKDLKPEVEAQLSRKASVTAIPDASK